MSKPETSTKPIEQRSISISLAAYGDQTSVVSDVLTVIVYVVSEREKYQGQKMGKGERRESKLCEMTRKTKGKYPKIETK